MPRFFQSNNLVHAACGVLIRLVLIGSISLIQAPAHATERPGVSHAELYSFDVFLDGHNNVAAALVSVPTLMTSSSFLDKNPDLVTYFAQHPEVQAELVKRPDVLKNREARFYAMGVSKGIVTRASADLFERYLVANPEVESQLRANPASIDSPQTLASQPTLESFLQENPGFAEAFKLRPSPFLARPDFFAHPPGERKIN